MTRGCSEIGILRLCRAYKIVRLHYDPLVFCFMSSLHVILICLFTASSLAQYRVTQKIDGLEDTGSPLVLVLEDDAPPASSLQQTFQTNSVLGGERDILLTATGGNQGAVAAVVVTDEELNLASPLRLSGSLLVQYDGTDGSLNLDPTGLNSLDLTDGGADLFRIRLECDVGATITVRVYSNGGVSEASISVGRLLGVQNIIIPFSAFDGNPDFTSVGAIELYIPFDENLDLGIQEFDVATGSATTNGPSRFVRPVEDYYIDYELGCERKVRTSQLFSTLALSSESSSTQLVPGLFFLVSTMLVFCAL